MVLEECEILPDDHLHPRIEAAAVAMYRSEWWRTVPPTEHKGVRLVRGEAKMKGDWEIGNAITGEIPWR